MSMYRRAHAGFDYELWLRRGHTGTPDDFLEWLRSGTYNGFSPKDFGAAGDGTTDDSDAILSAIEAAGEGGRVALDSGTTYLVTKTLTLKDGQTFDGNGATMIWRAPLTRDTEGNITGAPLIFSAVGSVSETPIPITRQPVCVSGSSSDTFGATNKQGFTYITVGIDPGLSLGDRIIIQAARCAMQQDSDEYWCGTATANAAQTYWAEILVVNSVTKTAGRDEWTIQCIGTLAYPYYLPNREEDVDIAVKVTEVCKVDSGKKTVVGYAVRDEDASAYLSREHSTIVKVDFLKDVCIKNLYISAEGEAHTGDTSQTAANWKGWSYANTIRLDLCEKAVIDNVHIRLTDCGRGFALFNCWNSEYRNCSYEVDYRLYGVAETQMYTNAFTFASTWSCAAINCKTTRAGQSFDTSYAGDVRCPALYTVVRDCTVTDSMNNSATNHAGAWGELFESCRFINCGRGLAIRSPHTKVINCEFSGQGGDRAEWIIPKGTVATEDELPTTGVTAGNIYYVEETMQYYRWNGEEWTTTPRDRWTYTYDSAHITITEPAARGCVIEGCSFYGGKAIQIALYNKIFFNFEEYANNGNYVTGGTYVPPESDPDGKGYILVDETPNPYPPSRKALGLKITGNVFSGCQNILRVSKPDRWNTDSNGQITEYAKSDLGLMVADNIFLDCGKGFYPVFLEAFSSGCEFSRNRFVRCVGNIPSYYTAAGEGKDAPQLIYIGGNSVRMKIIGNRVEECGGGFKYLYNKLAAVDQSLGTNGNPQTTETGNMLDRQSSDAGMSVATTGSDTEIQYTQAGKPVAERLIERADSNAGAFGHVYNYEEDRMELYVSGMSRVNLSTSALYSADTENTVGVCLLRSWCYIKANEPTTAQWRVAIYDSYVSQETFERLCECWDRGTDDEGNTVTFASDIVLDEGTNETDPETGEITHVANLVTYPAPLNKSMEFNQYEGYNCIKATGMYTKDADTGMIIVDVPEESAPGARSSCLAFFSIPAGFAPVLGAKYYVYTEVRENHTGSFIRVNANSSWLPSVFPERIDTPKTDVEEPPEGTLGDISGYAFKYNTSVQMNLGTTEKPWKKLYADEIHKIVVPSSTPDSTKRFRITVDDTGTITATEVT